MLSTRAAKWAKLGYMHGEQNKYDPETNAVGAVDLTIAENVSTCGLALAKGVEA
jgi:hypothetical protein